MSPGGQREQGESRLRDRCDRKTSVVEAHEHFLLADRDLADLGLALAIDCYVQVGPSSQLLHLKGRQGGEGRDLCGRGNRMYQGEHVDSHQHGQPHQGAKGQTHHEGPQGLRLFRHLRLWHGSSPALSAVRSS